MKKRNKRGVIQDYIIWIAIAVFVLGILFLASFLFKDKLASLFENIKNLFRFR